MNSPSETPWLSSYSLPFSRDAHCGRLSAWAKELGRFFDIPGGAALLESLAWLHDCPAELLDSVPEDLSQRTQPYSLAERIVDGVRALHGSETKEDCTALVVEIIRLANSLDEMLEWRHFSHQTAEQLFEELTELNQLCIWRGEVDAAMGLMSIDLLQKAVAQGDCLPVSALTVLRYLSAVPTELLTLETLCQVASADPVLAGDLLRVVNSWSHPMLRGRVSSVRSAVLHLGTEQARSVLMAAATRTLFASNAIRGIWMHSVRVAEIAASLSSLCDCDPEEAFLAGLLHDVGRLTIEKLSPSVLEIRARLMEQRVPLVWADLVTCRHDHGEIGGALLEKWNLPLGLADAVKFHHRPQVSDAVLTSVVYLAELRSGENEDFQSERDLAYALNLTGLSLQQVQQEGVNGRKGLRHFVACIA